MYVQKKMLEILNKKVYFIMKIFITLILSFVTILLFIFDDTLSKNEEDKTTQRLNESFFKEKGLFEKNDLGKLILSNSKSEIQLENDYVLNTSILINQDLTILGNNKTIYVDNVMIPFFLGQGINLIIKNVTFKLYNTKHFIGSKSYANVHLENVNLNNQYGSIFKFNKVDTFFKNVKFIKNDLMLRQEDSFIYFSNSNNINIENSRFSFNESEQSPIFFENIKSVIFKNNYVSSWVTGLFGSMHFWEVESGEVSSNTIEDENDNKVTVIDYNIEQDDEALDKMQEVNSYLQGSIAFSVMNCENLLIKGNKLNTYNVIFDDNRYLSQGKIDYIKDNNIIIDK